MNGLLITPYTDGIGYLALVLNLYSMSVQGEKRLRAISLIANGIYVLYVVLISATPIIVGCAVAVVLHAYRLHNMKKQIYGNHTTR